MILGLGFFVIMIAPALGIMKMAYMRITLVADHFEYMPMAGVIALHRGGRGDRLRGAMAGFVVALSAGCRLDRLSSHCCFSDCPWRGRSFSRSLKALWKDTLAKNPDAWQAHEHMGQILLERGDKAGALEHFKQGVELRPYLGEVHNNFGNTLRSVGRMWTRRWSRTGSARSFSPDQLMIVSSYKGDTLMIANRNEEAIRAYQAALKLNDANPFVYNNLGVISHAPRKNGGSHRLFPACAAGSRQEFQPAQAGPA